MTNLSLGNLPLKIVVSLDNVDSDLEVSARVQQNKPNAVNYFLTDFSQPMLDYVANQIMHRDSVYQNGRYCYYPTIYGEYYNFIAAPVSDGTPQWHKLSLYEGKNGARLKTYVTTMTVRHFIKLRNAELKDPNTNNTVALKENPIVNTLIVYNDFDGDGLSSMSEEMQWAWHRLNDKDRDVLTTLVIDEIPPIEAFERLQKHIKRKDPKASLTTAEKQTMMALLKLRAKDHLAKLIVEYRNKH